MVRRKLTFDLVKSRRGSSSASIKPAAAEDDVEIIPNEVKDVEVEFKEKIVTQWCVSLVCNIVDCVLFELTPLT